MEFVEVDTDVAVEAEELDDNDVLEESTPVVEVDPVVVVVDGGGGFTEDVELEDDGLVEVITVVTVEGEELEDDELVEVITAVPVEDEELEEAGFGTGG